MSSGRYRAYPQYKDSGIEWVGPMPASWTVKPLFAAAKNVCVKNADGAETNVLSLSYGSIVRRDIEDNFGLLPESFDTYQLVSTADIILRLTDLQNDKRSLRVGLAKENGIITSAYLKLTAEQSQLDSGYLYRLLHSYDTTKVFYGMGGGLRQSMKFDDMRRLEILLPPLPEQTQIAKFLDHETAEIDRLIEKQEALIRLLKEKRQAVISHVVTKGLNPDAPLKDSGVEWLGQVPAHWRCVRLKHAIEYGSSISYGIVQPGIPLDDGVPFVQTSNMSSGTFQLDELQKTTSHIARNYPRSELVGGEVILGIRASIGAAFVVPDFLKGYNISRGVARIVPAEGLISEYLVAFFRSDAVNLYWALGKQGSTFSEVSIDTVREIFVPIPPRDEQTEICECVVKRLSILDRLVNLAERESALLYERRAALISAAVTGKVDVRHWQSPKPAPSEASAA